MPFLSRSFARLACLLAVGAVGTVACDADAPRTTDPAASLDIQQQSVNMGSPEQQQALEDLGKYVALALDDQGLRQRIIADMRDSPFREHKLELRSYLSGNSGGILRAKVRQRSGLDEAQFESLLSTAPDLEFYVPIERDRLNWTGDATNLLVATQIHDDDDVVAFTTQGEGRTLDPYVVPDEVILSLVPVETDFTSPVSSVSSMQFQNVDETGGNAVGVMRRVEFATLDAVCTIEDCGGSGGGGGDGGGGDGGGGGGGGGSYWEGQPNGIYITGAFIQDLREPFTKGEPEIEVLTFFRGPLTGGEGVQINCAAESQPTTRQYVQNDNTSTDKALLASQEQVEASGDPPGLVFVIYEDDDTTCEIVDDNTNPENGLAAANALSSGEEAVTDGIDFLKATGAGFQIFAALGNIIQTNDDLIGFLIEVPCNGYDYSIVRDSGPVKGCANLHLNTEGPSW